MEKPLVGVVMGSQSDWDVMQHAARVLKDFGIRITRLAMGLPVGSDLDFADQVTIKKALEGRTELKD